jgi:hypothetical protein
VTIPAVVVNDTRADRHHGCRRVMRTLFDQAREAGIEVIATAPAHADWRSDAAFLKGFDAARLVIVNGEGSIHHDRLAGERLLEVAAAAHDRGVPAALINLSWQDNSPRLSARLAGFALISARERRSAEAIIAAGAACRVVPDLSLFPEVAAPPVRAGVGFTDSVVREAGLALEDARLRFGGRPAPIHFGAPGLPGRVRDLREAVGLADIGRPAFMTRVLLARWRAFDAQVADDAAYMARIASLALLVTGRFHAATFALAAGTPVLAVESNTHKIAALFEDAGLDPRRLVRPEALTAEHLSAAAHWTPAEAAALADYLSQGRARTRSLFADIARLAT